MICPYCLNKISKNSGICRHCESELPALYVKYAGHHSPLLISLVGFSAHGKTTYIAALLRELGQRLPNIWTGFFQQGIDRASVEIMRDYRSLMEAGMMPEATRLSFPHPRIYRLAQIPIYGDQQIVVYDSAGETFEDDLGFERYAHHAAKARSILFLISIHDLEDSVSLSMYRLLDNYIRGMERLRSKTHDQHLIVVYTKADTLSGDFLQRWPQIESYLKSDTDDSLRDLQGYYKNMATISSMLYDFTVNQLDAQNFINLAETHFKSVRYSMVSALGSQPDENYRLTASWQPVRVIDPLLWILKNSESRVNSIIRSITNLFTRNHDVTGQLDSVEPVWLHPHSLQDITQLSNDEINKTYHLDILHSNSDVAHLIAISKDVRMALASDSVDSKRQGLSNAITGLKILRRHLSKNRNRETDKWLLVVEDWQQVLLTFLDTLHRESLIVNPYQVGRPISFERHGLFKGRTELTELITRALMSQNVPAIVLHGPRRMGKTSLLLNLPKRLPWFIIPVFVDLQRPSATEDVASLLNEIAQKIITYSRIYRQLEIADCRLDDFRNAPFRQFSTWLESSALPKIKDSKILLCFDEYEKLSQAIDAGRIDERFLDELRYTMQHREALNLLFADVETLEDLGPNWSSYFINAYPVKIGYLSVNESEQLIRNPDPDSIFSLEYSDEAVNKILDLTRGHPYLIQLLCSIVVDFVNEYQTTVATNDIVEMAQQKAMEAGELYFRNVWDEFAGVDEKSVFHGRALLRQTAIEPLPVDQLPDTAGVSVALERLVHLMILEKRDGVLYHQIPLIGDWVLNHAPVE